jgi:hypothetical protein
MRRSLLRPFCVLGLAVVLLAAIRADEPAPVADPLRLLPDNCLFVVKAEKPQALIDLVLDYGKLPELQRISAYRDFLESTNFRRFLQLVAYVEKEYGHAWPELLDKLAGRGVALGIVTGKDGADTAVTLVMQGKDTALTRKAYETLLAMIDHELTRTESKQKLQRSEHRGIKVAQIGDAITAPVGDALVICSSDKALRAVIDRHLDKTKSMAQHPHMIAARKEIPESAMAWAWLNMEMAMASVPKEVKEQFFDLPSAMPFFHYIAGGWLEVARRSPYLTIDLCDTDTGPALNLRMPRGREGMHIAASAHVHPANEPGVLPLLEPKGTLYSTSFFWDPYVFWDKRKDIAVEGVVKELEEGDKNTAIVLLGRRFSQLLKLTGTRHRVVITRQFGTEYQTKPKDIQPAFALVMDSRDPDGLAKAIEPLIRGAALVGTFNIKMNLFEEKRGPWKMIGYRFAETPKNKANNHGLLFNFSPCYVRVGNQFIFSSTRELACTLIPLVEHEATLGTYQETASSRHRFSWSGFAVYLDGIKDQMVTATILQEGVDPKVAEQQVNELFKLLDRLGHVDAAVYYEPKSFRVELRTNYKVAGKK